MWWTLVGGWSYVACQQLLACLPVNRTLAAPPTQPGSPRRLRMATDGLQQRAVAPNTVGPHMPPPRHAQPLLRVWQRRMTRVATPWPPRQRSPPEPCPGCAACAAPNSPTGSAPVMGAAEQLAWAVPMGRGLPGVRLPDYAQRRPRWRHTPANAGNPLREYAPALARGTLCLPQNIRIEQGSPGREDPRRVADRLGRNALQFWGDGGCSPGLSRRALPRHGMPSVAVPPVGPGRLRTPPAAVRCAATPAARPFSGRVARRARPEPLPAAGRSWCP
jgi:hypothetical protein